MMNNSAIEEMSFAPALGGAQLDTALPRLLRSGNLMDGRLERACARLDERFRIYAAHCPVPQWAPGLILHGDLRSQHELYLPMDEIVPAFAHLCRASCLYAVDTGAIPLFRAGCWPDFLARLRLSHPVFNPASLLRRLATDERTRHAFLFSLFIPRSYGGSFGRYPRQSLFLARWLADARARLSATARLLDSACGCGEGTYEAAEILLDSGYLPEATRVCGSTLEPLELLAAAFGYYPDDAGRAAMFKSRVGPILERGGGRMIRFSREDVRMPPGRGERYDVVICNGLLGGPLLNGRGELSRAVGALAGRVRPGGILLVADNFHWGWKKSGQEEVISLLRDHTYEIVEAGEGIAAIKSGSATLPRRDRRQSP